MICNIDYILDLFDWNQSEENQKRGLELAKNVKCINAFLQPGDEKHNKNVWDNCAVTIGERTDEELKPYLGRLLEWIADMNWPGAKQIFERLTKNKTPELLQFVLPIYLNVAEMLNEEIWLSNLQDLKKQIEYQKVL